MRRVVEHRAQTRQPGFGRQRAEDDGERRAHASSQCRRSRPDSTVTKPSGSICRQRAQRRGADARARIRRAASISVSLAPSPPVLPERRDRLEPQVRIGASAPADSFSSAGAALGRRSRPSERTASIATPPSGAATSGISAAAADASFIAPSPLAANALRVRLRIVQRARAARGSARGSSSRCSAKATGHQRTRGCPARRAPPPPARRRPSAGRARYIASRNAAAGVSRDASSASSGGSRERARRDDLATPSGRSASAAAAIANQPERFGGAAFHERRRIGQRGDQRIARAAVADQAERERGHLPHFRIRHRRAAHERRDAFDEPTRPIASAARRRMRASLSVSSRIRSGGGGGGGGCGRRPQLLPRATGGGGDRRRRRRRRIAQNPLILEPKNPRRSSVRSGWRGCGRRRWRQERWRMQTRPSASSSAIVERVTSR